VIWSGAGDDRHGIADRVRPGHDAAVLGAEVRLLVDVLSPFGVLSRDELARRAEASLWHEGSFESALCAAARQGVIELLPEGFVAVRERRFATGGHGDRRGLHRFVRG
jgi:hypothetical protein